MSSPAELCGQWDLFCKWSRKICQNYTTEVVVSIVGKILLEVPRKIDDKDSTWDIRIDGKAIVVGYAVCLNAVLRKDEINKSVSAAIYRRIT